MFRPRLAVGALFLTGRRKLTRDRVRLVTLALVVCAIVGYVLERHGVDGSWFGNDKSSDPPMHSLLSDTGPWPVVLLVFVGLMQLWAYTNRMLFGLLTAIGALIATLVVSAVFLVQHLLSSVDHNAIGELFLPISLAALAIASLVQIVVEPWLAYAERTAIEWPQSEGLPSAVVVQR